ncbi:UDP-2,3-diacylglucosamine diphosphatase [Oricola thermophila]|uniref:UDP-2,3-diacylglucosamine diphosphatase n=1 Tax=Oricola thermophila TaxID=2742145 RepID=A0A6N1VA28_9HYPH|nr:UDP-2,3-diacylglucosamine diphosphatase [Oricola thermophila]QKV17373.1 UDP-2,3-diacylglucosamine diphosphatase [Oricola thermophila]
MRDDRPGEEKKFRTLFLSDIHLGTRGCRADMLLDFLREHDAEKIYLVGDIFDGWRLKRGWYWPQVHNDVVQKLLRKGRKGAEIVYVPGNHDEVMRQFPGTHFGGIEVKNRDIHETADGRKLLVIHGDQFDMVVVNAKWLAHVGDVAYTIALAVNFWFNRLRRLWGGQYWSLSRWAKLRVKQAVNFIGAYETILVSEAAKAGVDGVVCGHIHHAALTEMNGITYVNTGDWVESCTAIVEEHDGTLRLIDWSAIMRERNRGRLPAVMPQANGRKAKRQRQKTAA